MDTRLSEMPFDDCETEIIPDGVIYPESEEE